MALVDLDTLADQIREQIHAENYPGGEVPAVLSMVKLAFGVARALNTDAESLHFLARVIGG